MRYLLILTLFLASQITPAQTLFDLVQDNDIKALRAYEGAVNLRDGNQATPLMWAVFSADKKMVRLLIKKGADPGLKGWIIIEDTELQYELIYGSCLAIAAGKNKTGILKYFIRKQYSTVDDREINLDDNKDNGWTALHWAALSGNRKAAKYLIRKGADINAPAPTNIDQSPLQLAISFQQKEMVGLLLKEGANCNQTDRYGISPLSYAFQAGSREMVKLLVESGAQFGDKEHKVLSEELYKAFGIEEAEAL